MTQSAGQNDLIATDTDLAGNVGTAKASTITYAPPGGVSAFSGAALVFDSMMQTVATMGALVFGDIHADASRPNESSVTRACLKFRDKNTVTKTPYRGLSAVAVVFDLVVPRVAIDQRWQHGDDEAGRLWFE